MVVKEIPVTLRTYYSNTKAAYTQMKADAVEARNELIAGVKELHFEISNNIDTYKNEFGVNLLDYEEFVENKYSKGVFLKLAKGMFLNRKNNYVLVADLFNLLTLAKKQKQLYDIEKDIELYNKILDLNFKQYTEILRIFYTEVHKHMILKGEGYAFEGTLGWTCINRCHLEKVKPHIDYKATKERKAELLAQGKRIYNKEEAEWCRANGFEYNAEDGRVFQKLEYVYEIPLLDCKLPNGRKYKLVSADYRSREIRGLHNDELIEKCNRDTTKICELPLDLRTKLTLCNEVDKMLYLNFIRNENQKPSNATKTDRKD